MKEAELHKKHKHEEVETEETCFNVLLDHANVLLLPKAILLKHLSLLLLLRNVRGAWHGVLVHDAVLVVQVHPRLSQHIIVRQPPLLLLNASPRTCATTTITVAEISRLHLLLPPDPCMLLLPSGRPGALAVVVERPCPYPSYPSSCHHCTSVSSNSGGKSHTG